MNKHEKHKHDYYVNPHVIRAMINMIGKHIREHKIMVHMKHGCLKMLYMHVNDLIIMAFS